MPVEDGAVAARAHIQRGAAEIGALAELAEADLIVEPDRALTDEHGIHPVGKIDLGGVALTHEEARVLALVLGVADDHLKGRARGLCLDAAFAPVGEVALQLAGLRLIVLQQLGQLVQHPGGAGCRLAVGVIRLAREDAQRGLIVFLAVDQRLCLVQDGRRLRLRIGAGLARRFRRGLRRGFGCGFGCGLGGRRGAGQGLRRGLGFGRAARSAGAERQDQAERKQQGKGFFHDRLSFIVLSFGWKSFLCLL